MNLVLSSRGSKVDLSLEGKTLWLRTTPDFEVKPFRRALNRAGWRGGDGVQGELFGGPDPWRFEHKTAGTVARQTALHIVLAQAAKQLPGLAWRVAA
jgi:hypothetical protein